MSQSDSFIEEVTEEVRRDRLFALMKRYGWIAVLAVVLIVGGAAWNEYQKAQKTAAAEALGDAMLAALEENDSEQRVKALSAVQAGTPAGQAISGMLAAGEMARIGQVTEAAAELDKVAANADLPLIYRQIASFKALLLKGDAMPVDERRLQLEGLVQSGSSLRLLAEEQLALIEVTSGQTDDAVNRLNRIVQDSEVSQGLLRRSSQLIVALGGKIDAPTQTGGTAPAGN